MFEKLFRWGPDLLDMMELLSVAGEAAARTAVAHRHDPQHVAYRISPHYLEALEDSTDEWGVDIPSGVALISLQDVQVQPRATLRCYPLREQGAQAGSVGRGRHDEIQWCGSKLVRLTE